MAESLVLSDGTRSFDLLGDSALIYVRDGGFTLPVVSNENTYAEGSDSEGRSRVRYRATNSEAGSITVYFRGTTNALFRDAIDDLQELVVSANANKGTLAYTPPNGVEVTYDLESIQVTDMPQDGVALKNRHGEATISFEVKPFGRLASERLNVQDTYQEQVTALSPSIFLPLGASAGLTDLSGNARNGTAAGGVTVGGATGPLTVSDGGATDFDGTDDRITTTYATRRNLCTNPRFETGTTGWTETDADASMTVSASTDQAYDGTQSLKLVNTDAGGPDYMSMTFTGLAVGSTVTFSAYVFCNSFTAGAASNCCLFISDNIATTAAATLTAVPSGWERKSVTITLGGAATTATVYLYGPQGTVYYDAVLVELAASAGTYFPTTAQLASGEAGWTGTANASASDIGCFANGTTRTFMGWAYRDTSSGVDTIFSGSGATPPVLAFSSGSQNIVWKPDNSTTTTWASGISNGTWFHWELEFAEPTASNNASLYINGALISAQTNAGQYSANCGNFQLGALTSTTDPFDGRQAWVSVHQTALTATQIRDAYDTGVARISLDGPIDTFVVENIPGQVPAWPHLTLYEASGATVNHVEIGVLNEYVAASAPAILLQAVTQITALGGSSNTRASSYSTNILRAALATTPVAVGEATGQNNKGGWKVRARIYPSATTVRVRLAWRVGSGPYAHEPWRTVPGSAAWYDVDLGSVTIPEISVGTHSVTFRLEAMSTSGSPTVDLDVFEILPTDSYLKLRGASSLDTPTSAIVAMDDFSTQTSGAVTGKTPLLAPAGNWSGAGDADDFQVNTSDQSIYRDAVSDSALTTDATCGAVRGP